MEYQVWDNSTPDVSFKPASVSFAGYEFYLEQAKQVANYLDTMEVTEDNIKDVKKTLAQARKVVDELGKRRIAIKKEILSQYDEFEEKVKEISSVVTESEKLLRESVKALEEEEKLRKLEAIEEIWGKRFNRSDLSNYVDSETAFEHFRYPQMLNKGTSLSNVENTMAEWLRLKDKDIEILLGISTDAVAFYIRTFDLSAAINDYEEHVRALEVVEAANEEEEPQEEIETYQFIIKGTKDANFAELVLRNSEINFIKRRI